MSTDTINIEAQFGYNPAERRDPKGTGTGGQWTRGGAAAPAKSTVTSAGAGRPGAPQPSIPATDGGKAKHAGVRELGGITPGLTNMAEERELREQCAKAMALRKCSAFDTDCIARVAKENGLGLLADVAEHTAPGNWLGLLHDSMEHGKKYERDLPDEPPDPTLSDIDDLGSPIITANIGITANRGDPATNLDVIDDYYKSTRYRGWLTDLRVSASTNHVQIQDVVKAVGVWEGAAEPSASVWLRGSARAIKRLATQMGAEYNQDSVMTFTAEPDNKVGAVYTLPGLAESDREKAIKAMTKQGVLGGRILAMRDGGYALEVSDEDGSLFEGVQALGKTLGKDMYATPGTVTFLNNGEDYNKHPRQAKGRGVTHGTKSMQKELRFSTFWAWFDTKGSLRQSTDDTTGSKDDKKAPKTPSQSYNKGANQEKPALKDWGRDKAWEEAGITVNPLPRGVSLMHMRGGHMTDGIAKGDSVEVYTEEGEWQKGLVALSGVTQGEQGGPYDGKQVIWVGTADGSKLQPSEGQELPASLVRKAGGGGGAGGTSMDKRSTGTSAPGTDSKGSTGSATFSTDAEAWFYYNPGERRWPIGDPRGGQWAPNGGIPLSTGEGGMSMTNPGVYHRGLEAASGQEGPETHADPMVELTKGKEQKTGPAILQRYGLTQEYMTGQMIRRIGAADPKQFLESYTWYGQAADTSEKMGEDTKRTMTQAAMTLAATSPQLRWGVEYHMTAKSKRTVNQQIAYQILDMIGRHGEEAVEVTPEVAAIVRAKWPKLDLLAYNGKDFAVPQGSNVLGKHKIKDTPAEVLWAARPRGSWGTVLTASVVNGVIAAKTGDPRALGGPKTRSFYNDIRFPETAQDVTTDIFHLRVVTGHYDMMPTEVTEISNNEFAYRAITQATQAVAKGLGVLPHMLQAALWEQEHLWHGESVNPYEDTGGFYKRHMEARQKRINAARVGEGLAPIDWEAPEGQWDKHYWMGKFFEPVGTVLPGDKNQKPL